MEKFSIQAVTALLNVTVNGHEDTHGNKVGLYRSGSTLEMFFGGANIPLSIGKTSRLPAARNALVALNKSQADREKIVALFEQVADPREYPGDAPLHAHTVKYLDDFLKTDGYQLHLVGGAYRLLDVATNPVAAVALQEVVSRLELESVQRDFDQALAEADGNPEGAITAACSTVESVCKCLLDEMGLPYPAKQDIKGLVTEVGKHLNLSPARKDLPIEYGQDIRQILGGLSSVTGGIGSLRTHAGDAHGRGKLRVAADARIARLAIHAASTVSLFFIETWLRRNENAGKATA